MTVESAPTLTRAGSAPESKLEPNAIGVAQDTVIGMADAAPAASAGLTLAAVAAATAYASGPTLILIHRAVACLVTEPVQFDPVWDLPGK